MPPRRQGAAFVEILAETDGFEKGLQKGLDKAVDEASKSKHFEPLVKAAGDAGEKSGGEFAKRFRRDVNGKLRDEKGRLVSESGSAFTKAGKDIGGLAAKGFLSGFGAFLQAFGAAGEGLPLIGKLFGGLGKLGDFKSLGLGLGGVLIALGAFVAIAPLVSGAIFAIGGALFSLLGLLNAIPASIAIAAAALVPLVLAFGGFGEALTAIGQGDLKKIDEALKKLSPSARAVAREFQKLQPFFKTLQQDVQESFFSRLTGSLTALQKALGPAVSGGLQNVAFALGGFVDQLLKFAARPEVANIVARVFEATAGIITNAGPGIVRFLGALAAAVDAALPVLEQFFGQLFGPGVDSFSKFIQDSVKSGAFTKFLESALATVGSLTTIMVELVGLFKDMFLTTDEAGRTFLDDVGEAVKTLREFFQSPEGKEFIENMITLAKDFGTIMNAVFIPPLLGLLGTFAALIEAADDLGDAFDRLFGKEQKLKASSLGHSVAAAVLAGLPRFADGGITSGPSLAGEGGSAEAIIPLDDPVRARQVAQEANLGSLIGGAGDMTVVAYFDGEPFQARIVRTVRGANAHTARQLSAGPRSLVGA